MKKSKILTPILATATIGSMVAPLVTLVSCNKGETSDEITLDEATTKAEQTTTDTKTVTTYAFNLKNKLNIVTNDEEESEEIEVETEDVETSDDVTVEVSALQYDPETGKFYVTITTSKEEGTLTDEDVVTFSLNFHCMGKKSRKQRWEKKITNFVIKHSSSQIWSGHFDDTDVTKQIKKDKTTEKGIELTETIDFPINPLETWVETGATDDQYDLSKLKCYVLTDLDRHHFIETISLPESSKPLEKVELTGEVGDQTLSVTVPYTISEKAQYGAKARFTLLFVYPEEKAENAVFQSIGGFSINYLESAEEPKAELVGSREQHYYTAKSSETETAKNFIAFYVDSTVPSAKNLKIELAGKTDETSIKFGDTYLYDSTVYSTKKVYAACYTLEQKRENKGGIGDLYNVSLNITYTPDTNSEDEPWTEPIKGLTFTTVDKFTQTSLISYDATTLSEITWSISETMNFDNVLRTCYPFDINDFAEINAYATFEDAELNETHEADITLNHLGYLPYSEKYSEATIDTSDIDAGTYNVKVYVQVVTWNAAYYYCLNVGEKTLAE